MSLPTVFSSSSSSVFSRLILVAVLRTLTSYIINYANQTECTQGKEILQTLLTTPTLTSPVKITTIHALTRRALPSSLSATSPSSTTSTPPKLQPHTSTDTTTWAPILSSLHPSPKIFISALGTTRAAAGSFAAQRLIDYDLNLSLARAAHTAGARVYVLISSAGVSSSSPLPYSKLKGDIENAVAGIGFDTVVLLKPGLLLGKREETRTAEGLLRGVAGVMCRVLGERLGVDWWAQEVGVIGRAAARAGVMAARGEVPEGAGVTVEGGEGKEGPGKSRVWRVEMREILRLGRDEWRDE